MITEERVFDLARLIDSSWSRSFVTTYLGAHYARTDAPLAYGVAGAMSLLAANTHPDLSAVVGGRVYNNIYTIVVGPSGYSRKSTAVNIADEIQRRVDVMRIGSDLSSLEAFEAGLVDRPQQVLFFDEFGDFLSQSSGQGYFRPFRERLTKMYDCRPIHKTFQRKEPIVIEKPRLSIYGGVTHIYLEAFTGPTDWEGGFIGRLAPFSADPKRFESLPQHRPDLEEWCCGRLLEIQATHATTCGGFEPDAYKFFDEWARKMRHDCLESNEAWVASGGARTQAWAVKYSMLLSLDAGVPVWEPGWRVPQHVADVGVRIALMNFDSINQIVGELSSSPYAKERRNVVRVLTQRGRTCTLGKILAGTNPKMQKRDVERVLETLIEEEVVWLTASSETGQKRYTLDKPVAGLIETL